MPNFSNIAVPGLTQTQVSGLSELEQNLKDLGPKQAKKAFREAGTKATQIWITSMEQLAPRRSGFLVESIDASARASGVNEVLVLHVGPSKAAYYAGFDEFGTRYMPPHPFARPTFEEHQDDVLRIFADELWTALQALAK